MSAETTIFLGLIYVIPSLYTELHREAEKSIKYIYSALDPLSHNSVVLLGKEENEPDSQAGPFK